MTGPLRVSADGRYFVDTNAAPFFWLGDTAWPLFTSYRPEDAEAYLRDRAHKGFSAIQAVLAWSGGTNLDSTRPLVNHAGQRAWDDDPAQPNESFFVHVDHLVRFAAELGLVLALLPTWGSYVNHARVFNPHNARDYGRWLGARYRDAPNIVWVNGGDHTPVGFEAIYRALAEGLREGDGGAHLITYHPNAWRSSAHYFHAEPWLDFHMIETWQDWPMTHAAVLADAMLRPTKPVVLAEGAYEDGPEYGTGPITPLIVRRQAWWSLCAGGFWTYGHNRLWRMEAGWTAAWDAPGAQQMQHFKRIATGRPWWRMASDQSLFAAGGGNGRTLNTALRAYDGSAALVYLSSQCHALIYLHTILAARVRCTLVDPRSGEQHDAGVYATGNDRDTGAPQLSNARWFTTPMYWEDALLLLDAV